MDTSSFVKVPFGVGRVGPPRNGGFSLIELMITVVIIGILAGIAIPSYQEHIKKTRRAMAQAALLEFSGVMERRFTVMNTYCDAGTDASAGCGSSDGDTGAPTVFFSEAPLDGATKYYDLAIQAVTPTSYTLRASPKGAQAGDGYLDLTSTGARRWDRNNNGTIDADEGAWGG